MVQCLRNYNCTIGSIVSKYRHKTICYWHGKMRLLKWHVNFILLAYIIWLRLLHEMPSWEALKAEKAATTKRRSERTNEMSVNFLHRFILMRRRWCVCLLFAQYCSPFLVGIAFCGLPSVKFLLICILNIDCIIFIPLWKSCQFGVLHSHKCACSRHILHNFTCYTLAMCVPWISCVANAHIKIEFIQSRTMALRFLMLKKIRCWKFRFAFPFSFILKS